MTTYTLTANADTLYLYKGGDGYDADLLDAAGNPVVDVSNNPIVFVSLANDLVDGGAGIDTIESDHGFGKYFSVTNDAVGVVTLTTASGKTTYKNFEKIKWADGSNVNLGTSGADTITGTKNGDTFLNGFGAADKIDGGIGNDKITGGEGKDTLKGGVGADVFDFNAITESKNTARDVISDFTHATDKIDVSTIDANSKVAGNQNFSKTLVSAFTHKAGQIHVVKQDAAGTANDKMIVEFDTNGDAKADFSVELTGIKVLSGVDFIV